MGYPEGHKAQTRQKIIVSARALWKEKGYEGASVDQIMATAGLTRGGFYAHFNSKKQLLEETLRDTPIAQYLRDAIAKGDKGREEILEMVLAVYLGKEHRDNPGAGCPLTSLTQEASRLGLEPREVLTRLVSGFANWLGEDGKYDGLAALAMMVGAVTLARAVTDQQLSDALLTQTRKQCQALLSSPEV